MVILGEIFIGILEIVIKVFVEVIGYMIWGLLQGILTQAGGFLGGTLVGAAISVVWFYWLSSTGLAILASCVTVFVCVILGLAIESGGASA